MSATTTAQILARMKEDTDDSRRYLDMEMHLRRLSVAHGVKGQRLTAPDGTVLLVGERSESGDYPVAAADETKVRSTAHLQAGVELRSDDGLVISLRVEVVLSCGGVWDRIRKQHLCDETGQRVKSAKPHVFDLVESQMLFARRFVAWLDDYRAGHRRIRSLMGFGKRRSGKSVITLMCLVAFALEVPRIKGRPTVCWLILVSHPQRGEIDDYIRDFLPKEWLTYHDKPFHTWRFAHGVSMSYKTTEHDTESLRTGTCDAAMMNEAAKQKFDGYKNCLRGITDNGGIMLLASNTPTKSTGEWITDVIMQIDARKARGQRPVADYLTLDPALNPKIDQEAVDDVDEIVGGIRPDEVDEGLVRFVDERAYSPPFVEAVHVVTAPKLGLPDITRDVTQAVVGRAYDYIAGTDFQYNPHQVSVIFKVYGTVAAPILWAIDEIYSPKATEDEHIDEIEAEGYRSGNTLVVGDCSGETQGALRTNVTSFEYYEKRGWHIVGANKKVDPRGRAPKNPNVEKSIGRVHHALTAPRGPDGKLRAMMVDPHCTHLILDLLKCKLARSRSGVKPVGVNAHGGDAFRYPQWWLTTFADRYTAPAADEYSRYRTRR